MTAKRALTLVNNQPHLTMPKTRTGARRIALDPHTVAVLRRYRQRQGNERELTAELWQEQGLLSRQQDGTPLHPWSVSRRSRTLARQAGLPPLTSRFAAHLRDARARRWRVPGCCPAGSATPGSRSLSIYVTCCRGGDQRAAGTVADRILGAHADLDGEGAGQV